MTALDNATTAIATARRASAADRNSGLAFEVEFRPLAQLEAIIDPWRELAAHAIEPNVFYEPAFALAAASLLGADVVVGLVWADTPSRQLAGLFPVRIDRHRYGMPLPVLVGWTHPYAPLGTPLVHREMAEPAIAAWLDHVARDPDLPDIILWHLLSEEGPFTAALASVLARRGCEAKSFGQHQRPLFAPGENRAGYFERDYLVAVGVSEDQIVLFPDDPSGVAGMQASQIDAYTATSMAILTSLNNANDPGLEMVDPFTDPVVNGKSVTGYSGTAFRKEDADLRDAFNAELKKLKDSGQLLEILEANGFGPANLPGDATAEMACQP